MKRFLKALLIPILIVAALNWRTITSIVRFSFTTRTHQATLADLPQPTQQTDNTLVIPSIDLDIPVIPSAADPTKVSDWGILKQNLTQGVGLAEKLTMPGSSGTTMIIGHSSDLYPHPYAAVFAGLNSLAPGDPIQLRYKGQTYTYTATSKRIVEPNDLRFFEELEAKNDGQQLALVTCWPLFTSAKRLVVIATPAVLPQ
jgi:LPXTG-site transpeptidase (sortase) family protein